MRPLIRPWHMNRYSRRMFFSSASRLAILATSCALLSTIFNPAPRMVRSGETRSLPTLALAAPSPCPSLSIPRIHNPLPKSYMLQVSHPALHVPSLIHPSPISIVVFCSLSSSTWSGAAGRRRTRDTPTRLHTANQLESHFVRPVALMPFASR